MANIGKMVGRGHRTAPSFPGMDMSKMLELQNNDELGELLDTALRPHQALPEKGYASQRAMIRLAL